MKTLSPLSAMLPLLIMALGLFSCEEPAPQENLVEVASGKNDVSTLVKALQAADLQSALEGEGPFTVFAPTDDAFANLPEGVLDALLQAENKEALSNILRYHVVSGQMSASDISSAAKQNGGTYELETLSGGKLMVKMDDEGANILLEDAQGNTVSVQKDEVKASNGILHPVNGVLLPAGVDPTALVAGPDIVAVASGNEDFSTLVAAVKAAGLVETLQGEGPFTVFAPTDAAFEALPEGTLEMLLKPESKDQLTGILTYHVVAGAVDAATLTEAIQSSDNGEYTISTVNGGELTASIKDGNVILTDAQGRTAQVVATDVDASNGLIHVIDTVVMP